MDPEELAYFRAKLEEMRDAIIEQGNIPIQPNRTDQDRPPDEDTQPLNEMLQTIASSRNKSRSLELRRIQAALRVLYNTPEDYGYCEVCDDEVPRKRLELMPYATLCVTCQSDREDPLRARRRHLTDYK